MSKKVVFLINSMTGGGAEKIVKTLVENLSKENYGFELICLEKDNIYKINNNIKITYLSDSNKKLSELRKFIYLPIFSYKLYRYIKVNNIKLVQSHLYRANYVNLLSKFLFRSKHNIQVVNHSIMSRYKKEGIIGKINLFLIKILYPFSNKIISVSTIVEKDMQQIFDFKNDKKVIYNMFDIKKIQILAKEEVNFFNFDENKKYIISVGRIIPLKRNKDLIFALAELDEHIELIFIGEGEIGQLNQLSNELNISSRVHFLGWTENPYKYIKQSDLLVSCSETESFGNVLIEAMVLGVPVISTKCGGPEEIIDNFINGLLVDIGNIKELVFSINYIMDNENIKNNLIKNGFLNIRRFSTTNILKEYKKILCVE